jgi:hypothetical protein
MDYPGFGHLDSYFNTGPGNSKVAQEKAGVFAVFGRLHYHNRAGIRLKINLLGGPCDDT